MIQEHEQWMNAAYVVDPEHVMNPEYEEFLKKLRLMPGAFYLTSNKCIRVEVDGILYCPMTYVAGVLGILEWHVAASKLGIMHHLAKDIVMAADDDVEGNLPPDEDAYYQLRVKIRQELLEACHLETPGAQKA